MSLKGRSRKKLRAPIWFEESGRRCMLTYVRCQPPETQIWGSCVRADFFTAARSQPTET